MIKISAVSYLNTKPFIFGLEPLVKAKQVEVSLDFPSACAKKLIAGEVDLGLVPVAAIPFIPNAQLISEYCIGSDGPVNTVMLYSDVPLKSIKSIYLDYQSRTSVNLIRILADHYWHIKPQWKKSSEGYEDLIKGDVAGVVIGDRAFAMNERYEYVYDLSQAWKSFTGLPFVFACWVSNKVLDSGFVADFNKALGKGIEGIDLFVSSLPDNGLERHVLENYFKKNISYNFCDKKRQALHLFLNYLKVYSDLEQTK